MKYCSACGKELQDDMRFCPYCGIPLNSDQQIDHNYNQGTSELKESPKKKGGCLKTIVTIIILLFLCLFAVQSCNYSYKQGMDPFDGMNVDEFVESCYEVSYSELARYPDKYVNEHIIIEGKIIQVIENGTYCEYRVATKELYDDVVFASFTRNEEDPRLLEGDFVKLYGISLGLITYTSTTGLEVTIPQMLVSLIEF